MDYLKGLNTQQTLAVEHMYGPLLIVAGAGAGKTKTIVSRIAHLSNNGVAPSSILAITFTNKAAFELRERIYTTLQNTTPIFASTFHSFGVWMLRRHSEKILRTRFFSILDRDDSLKVIKRVMKELPASYKPESLLHIISKNKSEGVNVNTWTPSNSLEKTMISQWQLYEEYLKKSNACDFDDLIMYTRNILRDNDDIRKNIHLQFSHIFVDEFQDTNVLQYDLLRLLVGPGHNICVVGDADQTIYTWRGATIQNILSFEKDFPNTTVVLLEQNYRSTKNILKAADAIIVKNTNRKEKTLFTDNQEGQKISLLVGFNETDEAYKIAHQVQYCVNNGIEPSKIAILYRANYQSRVIEDSCIKESIPYSIIGTRFFDRKEIKDAISYIRASTGSATPLDIERIVKSPRRGIGEATLDQLFKGGRQSLTGAASKKAEVLFLDISRFARLFESRPLSEAVAKLLDDSGLISFYQKQDDGEERVQNIFELVSLAQNFDHLGSQDAPLAFLEHVALQSDQDELSQKKDGVRLMTIHASKGLEFDTVFVCGLEEGLFPSNKQFQSTEEKEEERRLMYVAVTRAERKLYVSYALSRHVYGQIRYNEPSAFLDDIPEDILELPPELSQQQKKGLLDDIFF